MSPRRTQGMVWASSRCYLLRRYIYEKVTILVVATSLAGLLVLLFGLSFLRSYWPFVIALVVYLWIVIDLFFDVDHIFLSGGQERTIREALAVELIQMSVPLLTLILAMRMLITFGRKQHRQAAVLACGTGIATLCSFALLAIIGIQF